jgi:chromosome segregation ATPase
LVSKVFGKFVLVQTYALAMQVAKDYNLTCITPDHQIVFAGAFLTQVGQYTRSAQDRPTLYRKVSALEHLRDEKLALAS